MHYKFLDCIAWLVVAVVALSQNSFAAGDESRPTPKRLTADLFLEMESVSGPKLSPDGKQVVFARTWVDKVNDKQQSELWIMDADGARLRQLTEGSAPVWSPDGTRIAFLRDGKPQGAQIHVLWVGSREVSQITHVEEAPNGLRWSPDSQRIAFQMVVAEKQDFLPITLPKRPKDAKWADDATIITRLNYRRDQRGYRPAGFQHLFVVDASGGTPRQISNGGYDHGVGEWTPDGRALVFSGLRAEDADWQVFEAEIYSIDVATGSVKQLTTRKGEDDNPKVSPDGRYIAYTATPDPSVSRDTYAAATLMIMRSDGSEARALTQDLDRDPTDIYWLADSSGICFTANSAGSCNVWRVGLSGAPRELTPGAQRIAVSDLARDGRLVGTLTQPLAPADVVVIEPRASGPATIRKLTSVNADVLDGLELGAVEEIRYRSVDGLEIQGWLVLPPRFDPAKKYPLILQIHGGPHAMYGVDWSFERQLHAAEDFVVLYTNPRGSTGYGSAFGNAIKFAYPSKDYDDLMYGVDAAIARGCIDEEKLFVYGGSGGGVLTAWAVGHTTRFRAAVSMFPVINWTSFVGTTDGPYWYTNFAKLPWDDITEHWNRSPLKYVGKVKTPTLLITGELDLRTPIGQTEEYYQALKLLKVDTAMIRIPDEYHGAGGRHVSNLLRRMLYVQAWFKKYLPKESAQDATGAVSPASASF
ncbi:MAG: S9 family peptidase [Planctomycetota bacterium]